MTRYIGITGLKKTGKTTAIEALVPQLLKKNLKVGTVKIAFKDVSIDVNDEHYDVIRHRQVNPHRTLFKSKSETTFFVNETTSLRNALKEFSKGLDLVLLEGFKEDLVGIPQIALLKSKKDLNDSISKFTVAISSIPEFNVKIDDEKYIDFEHLTEIIIENALPLIPELNCTHCGYNTCNEFIEQVIKGREKINNCEIIRQSKDKFILKVNGKFVPCLDFVQNVFEGVISSIVNNLKLEESEIKTIDIEIDYKKDKK